MDTLKKQLQDDSVIEYYNDGFGILRKIYDKLSSKIIVGQNIYELTEYVEKEIEKLLSNIDVIRKGLSFPICIFKNNIVGNYSQISFSDDIINVEDIIKVEIGIHINGYPVILCKSYFIDNENQENIHDKSIKLLKEAKKKTIELMKIGKSNKHITDILTELGKKYEYELLYSNIDEINIPGISSYQMSQNIIDNYNDDKTPEDIVHKMILNRKSEAYNYDIVQTTFEKNEVYCINIVYSLGSGIIREGEILPMIYKRNNLVKKSLRLKTSRELLNKVTDKSKYFPCTLKDIDNKLKLGLNECIKNEVLERYPVYETKCKSKVINYKFTVLLKDKPIVFAL